MKKFLSLSRDTMRRINLDDSSKWQKQGDSRSYKLLNPNLETDRYFTNAVLKSVKAFSPDEKLYIAGIANANIVDRVDERVDPRGGDLINFLKNPQLLAHHSYYNPIGQVDTLDIQDDGLHFLAWIGDPARGPMTEMQMEIRSLVAQGILKTVSIGFIPKSIRAPLFDDLGNMTEPMVIEAWELLEISIVAIPCNQDSLFSVRDYQNPKAGAKVVSETQDDDSTSDEKNGVAQTPIVVQTSNVNPEVESTKAKNGAKPMANPARKDAAPPAEGGDQTGDQGGMNEVLTLCRSMAQDIKSVVESCKTMMEKMDAKPPAAAGDAPPAPPKDDAAKMNAKIDGIEKTVNKLSDIVKVLAEKMIK